jgi:hypothetical protein
MLFEILELLWDIGFNVWQYLNKPKVSATKAKAFQ